MRQLPTFKLKSRQWKCVIPGVLALFLNHGVHAGEIGQPAPNCTLTQVDNSQALDLQKFRGEVVYVDFWASWCGPCAQSFPFLNDLDREYRSKGLHIVGVNLDENREDANSFLAQHPAGFTIVADADEQCARSFGVKAMPSSYLIDRNGIIRYEQLGFRSGEAVQLRELTEKLLAENPAIQKR